MPHHGFLEIAGDPVSGNKLIVNVDYMAPPPVRATDEYLEDLATVDQDLAQAKAKLSLISDNTKTLESSQAAVRIAYAAMLKVEADFVRRIDTLKVVQDQGGILVQYSWIGTDRKDTSPGYLGCVSDVDGKTPTTTNINYSLLYETPATTRVSRSRPPGRYRTRNPG